MRRVLPVVAALALVAALPGPASTQPPRGPASVPDRFATFSMLTASVTDAPPGRAVMLYEYGGNDWFNQWQELVVGADRDTYRTVPQLQERADSGTVSTPGLLAPDGTRILVGDERGATDHLLVIDLGTGRTSTLPVDPPGDVRMLAWSPDGRYAAYTVLRIAAFDGPAPTAANDDELAVVDLSTGASHRIPGIAGVRSVTFSPTGDRLAVQATNSPGAAPQLPSLNAPEADVDAWYTHPDTLWIVGTGEGGSVQPIATTASYNLAPEAGWTPDGDRLFVARFGTSSGAGLIDVANPAQVIPLAAGCTDVLPLAWTAPDRFLAVHQTNPSRPQRLVEVSLSDCAWRDVARFDAGSVCDVVLSDCWVVDMHVAAGLAAGLTVRRAGPADLGPWPWWLRLSLFTAGALLVAVAVLVVRRRRVRHCSVSGTRPVFCAVGLSVPCWPSHDRARA